MRKKPDVAGVNQAFYGGRLAGIRVAWVVAGRSVEFYFYFSFHFCTPCRPDPTDDDAVTAGRPVGGPHCMKRRSDDDSADRRREGLLSCCTAPYSTVPLFGME